VIRRLAVLGLLLIAACRTTRPPNAEPLVPLTSGTPAEAAQQLAMRRSEFRGERSLIRLHLPKISARGQLQVDSAGRMLMTVYTPVGTSAARLYVDGDQVTFLNDLQSTAWRGKASDLAGTLGMFGNSELPLLLVGLPAAGVNDVTYAASGIQAVHLSGVTVSFEPPAYPPKIVAIDRGEQHVTIEHLDSFVDVELVNAPEIPRDYTCCILPQI
jgi:hypothetical protein